MYKKLYRSRSEKMIGGVAGGIAVYFEIDPTLVRILFIISLFLGGSGILAYIILWIVVPEAPDSSESFSATSGQETTSTSPPSDDTTYKHAAEIHKEKRTNAAGIILIVIGFLFLADNIFPRFDFDKFWPLILIAIGAGLLLNSKK